MILGAAVIAPLQSGLVGRVTGPAGTRGRPGAARGYDPPPTSAAGSILLVWYSRFPASSGYTEDRKSTRLNSSHVKISYAVFCWKKKKRHQDKQDETPQLP